MVITKRVKHSKLKNNFIGIGMAAIPIIGFLIFSFLPLLISFFISFVNLQDPFFGFALDKANPFAFLANYRYVFTDTQFLKSILTTLYCCCSIPFEIILGVLLANFLNEKLKMRNFFRAVYFFPYICSVVAISIAWKIMFDTNPGVINTILGSLNLPKLEFLYKKDLFIPSIIIMTVWTVVGYDTLLCQAGLANIDNSIYEAAKIDGCPDSKLLFKITLPLITPTLFFLLITSLIGGLQSFTRIHTMNLDKYSAGPDGAGLTMVYYIFSHFTGERGVTTPRGYAISSSATMLVTIIIGLVTLFNFKLSKKWVHYND